MKEVWELFKGTRAFYLSHYPAVEQSMAVDLVQQKTPEKVDWPDFTLVLSIEEVLPAHPLRHDKLQSRFPCRTRQTAQELQQRLQLGVNQVSKHHDERLQRERERGGRGGWSDELVIHILYQRHSETVDLHQTAPLHHLLFWFTPNINISNFISRSMDSLTWKTLTFCKHSGFLFSPIKFTGFLMDIDP